MSDILYNSNSATHGASQYRQQFESAGQHFSSEEAGLDPDGRRRIQLFPKSMS